MNTIKEVERKNFQISINQKKTDLFTLRNKNGMIAQITNYGARLVTLLVPGAKGDFLDVVLGFSSIQSYVNANEQYHGATIGRYANRIERGIFELDGTTYNLATNNNTNHLHGGVRGFDKVVWDAVQLSENSVELSYFSNHMEEGYPGNLPVKVKYELTDQNELEISYDAETDQKTLVNLTHHSYFNLSGEGSSHINDHELEINASHYTPLKENFIPTGKIESVENTPFDFQQKHAISNRLNTKNEQLQIGQGYDHNYVLNEKSERSFAARANSKSTGIIMEVQTDQPGMQLYSANFLDGSDTGKSGKPYHRRSAFCLETQHYPNSPNQPNFPSTVLIEGQRYQTFTTYKFLNDISLPK